MTGMLGFLPVVPLLTMLAAGNTEREVVSSPRVAQVRLAETLAQAESIESVTGRFDRRTGERRVTFVIVRDGSTFEVAARTTKSGEIVAIAIEPAPDVVAQLHGLTWLASELAEVTAVIALAVDDDGAVTLSTDDGRRYMAIPGRGSGGSNVAAEARWAAQWNHDES
jgi:hypothetical protein